MNISKVIVVFIASFLITSCFHKKIVADEDIYRCYYTDIAIMDENND